MSSDTRFQREQQDRTRETVSRRAFNAGAGAVAASMLLGRQAQAQTATQPAEVKPPLPIGTPQIITPSQQKYPLTQEKVTFKVLVTSDVDHDKTMMSDWYEQLTNVHAEWVVVPAENAIQQLSLLVSSGDIPDLILGWVWVPFTTTQLAVYGDQGVFVDLKDHIAKAAPTFQQAAKELPEAWDLVTAPSGAIYAMPQLNNCYHCSLPQKLWLNTKWLAKVGMETPKTPEEFTAVLQAFKDKNPSGFDQSIPLITSATTDLGDLDAFLMNPFTFSPGEPWVYIGDDGKIATAYTQDGWKDGVVYMRELYAKGLLYNQTFSMTTDQVLALGSDAKGTHFGAIPTFWRSAYVDQKAPSWKDFNAIPQLKGPTGLQQTYKGYYAVGNPGGFVVTQKCKDPELAVRWADGMYATETTLRIARGMPGIDWAWAKPGSKGIDDSAAIWQILPDADTRKPKQYKATGWSENAAMYFSMKLRNGQEVVIPRDEEVETILYDATKANQEPYQVPKEKVLPPLFFNTDQANIISLNGTSVTDLVKQQYAKWVTGQGDPEKEWSSYLDQLKSVGYEDLMKVYQDALDARSKGKSGG